VKVQNNAPERSLRIGFSAAKSELTIVTNDAVTAKFNTKIPNGKKTSVNNQGIMQNSGMQTEVNQMQPNLYQEISSCHHCRSLTLTRMTSLTLQRFDTQTRVKWLTPKGLRIYDQFN